MLITLICGSLFLLCSLLIRCLLAFVPDSFFADYSGVMNLYDLIQRATVFVPSDMIFLLITSVVWWYAARLAWAVVEWIYNKFPGVN